MNDFINSFRGPAYLLGTIVVVGFIVYFIVTAIF